MTFGARLRKGLRRVFNAFDQWWDKKRCVGYIEGIAICDTVANKLSESTFLKSTREAMELIQAVDIRRYRRICRQFRFIVNKDLINTGNYNRETKRCRVDHTRCFSSQYPQWNLRKYACLLIHEATHGTLLEKGISYNKENWQRVEKLCCEEEIRFARRIDPVWAKKFVRPFDSKEWRLSWGTREERRAAAWARIKEIFRSGKSS